MYGTCTVARKSIRTPVGTLFINIYIVSRVSNKINTFTFHIYQARDESKNVLTIEMTRCSMRE